MMARVVERARARGERRADIVRQDVAARIAAEVHGVTVSVEGDDVVVAGRGLSWRAVSEPALRWAGSLLK